MAKHDVHQFCARLGLPALVIGLSGCVMWMREPEFYTEELSELLEQRSEAIEACYDRFLSEEDPKAQGEVVVNFEVEAKTGELTNIEVSPDSPKTPEALARCVTDELDTLALDPPDVKRAEATFTWAFVLGSQKRPPADPFAGAQEAVLACYSDHLREVDREARGELVVDYALDPETGAVAKLELVSDATTAPAPVVECATAALESAHLDPAKLDERNQSGRRTFALRYTPHEPQG
ncbi:hypothetical protein ENSA5_13700 [Enhygromyxa salina]|uniref:Uncharacterized protein n=1 Tax=Enhygromyxa salina TaxID=215803 RepID=A0A2S9YEZ6_9BACT|nr:hypothetical protein [Enhygromyxa salina]PRQ03677.1 hypothetical protein ENSA5_13700 [Enhygromyxa salina]